MKKLIISLHLIGLILGLAQISARADTSWDIPADLIEVKDLGVSDRDESRSIIEIRWSVGPDLKDKIVSFNLVLSVTYADGTTLSINRKLLGDSFSDQIEVPSVRWIGGRSLAFIKKMDARVTAVISEKLTQ